MRNKMAVRGDIKMSTATSIGKQLTSLLFTFAIFVSLQLTSNSIVAQSITDNQIPQSQSESTVPASETNDINSTSTPTIISNQVSTSPKPSSTPQTTSTSTTLPPPLPTPLPAKGYHPMYSGSSYLRMEDLLQSPSGSSFLGRTKRMKRSRPSLAKGESLPSENPFSLIKLLLANHLTSPADYPMSYSLTTNGKPTTGQFGPIYSNGNSEDSLFDQNDLSSGSLIHPRIMSEQSSSFYPLSASDIETLELDEGDGAFDSGFGAGAGADGWSNPGILDLINPTETDEANVKNNNNVDLYSLDPFIPLRSFRSSSSVPFRSQSGLFMRPLVTMKRKRRLNGLYSYNHGTERSPNSFILGSGNGNHQRTRSKAKQYEQLISNFGDNPNSYL